MTVNSVEAFMKALTQLIEASSALFWLCSGGDMQFLCGTKLDHGVLTVGCGTDGQRGLLERTDTPEYWWCTEQMLTVPGVEGCDGLVDDGGDASLLTPLGAQPTRKT